MKKCANCGHPSLPFALRCDCGGPLTEDKPVMDPYRQAARQVSLSPAAPTHRPRYQDEQSWPKQAQGRRRRRGGIAGAVIGGCGSVLWGFIAMETAHGCDGGTCVAFLGVGLFAALPVAAIAAIVGAAIGGRTGSTGTGGRIS